MTRRGGYQGSAPVLPLSVPRTPGASEDWPEWAHCPLCRRAWNANTSLTFGPGTKGAESYFARLHATHGEAA